MAEETVRWRILFVDDSQSIRLTLPRILAKSGFEVTSVAGLDDALVEIRTEKFDALLTDLSLAEANSGFIVVEAMRRAQPSCVNFVMTDHPVQEHFQQASRYGVAHYFKKPVDVEKLVSTLKRELTSHDSPSIAPQSAPRPRLNYPWQRVVLSAFTEGRSEKAAGKSKRCRAGHRRKAP